MAKKSAGILLFRQCQETLELLLVHPGGPFWKNKDEGAWTIPKGELHEQEDALQAAQREFEEETGQPVAGYFIELSPVKQKGGKIIYAWALEGDFDVTQLRSNLFEVEWPPRSGKKQSFPEIDRAAWFSYEETRLKILPAQWPLVEELKGRL